MKKIIVLALLGIITMSSSYHIQGVQPGDKANDFSLKNANITMKNANKKVGLKDYKNAKGAIIIFTCNHCPFSVAYEDRIIALHKKYAPKGYPVIAINPNDPERIPKDSYDAMKKRAKSKDFPFAYLHDETQKVAKAYGATRTPHVFLTQKEKDKHIVQFIGAIDDSSWEADAVETKYLENVLTVLLKNKPIKKTTAKAVGCTIKWKR